jgi:WhiB family redox-sensing transcriptional regulator
LDREKEAKAICATCGVRKDCLAYALRIHEPYGIWGGMNEAERGQMMGGKVAG